MNCKYLHKVTSVTVGTTVVLGFDSAVTLNDTEKLCIKLCKSIPASAYGLAVYATINGTSVPLWNKYGNPLTAEDLSKCHIYKAYYGATTPHVIVTNEPSCNGC